MDTEYRNGWKKRPLWQAFADGFQGIGEASRERIMRVTWGCLIAMALALTLVGIIRGFKPLGWILLIASAGVLISREHDNSARERQEHRLNKMAVQLGLQNGEWNEHTRYILHQSTASVLVLGLSGLIAGTLVLIYNP